MSPAALQINMEPTGNQALAVKNIWFLRFHDNLGLHTKKEELFQSLLGYKEQDSMEGPTGFSRCLGVQEPATMSFSANIAQ